MGNVLDFPLMRTRPIPDRENATPAIILVLPVIRIERYVDLDEEGPIFVGMDLASGPDMTVIHTNCRCSSATEKMPHAEKLRPYMSLMRGSPTEPLG